MLRHRRNVLRRRAFRYRAPPFIADARLSLREPVLGRREVAPDGHFARALSAFMLRRMTRRRAYAGWRHQLVSRCRKYRSQSISIAGGMLRFEA